MKKAQNTVNNRGHHSGPALTSSETRCSAVPLPLSTEAHPQAPASSIETASSGWGKTHCCRSHGTGCPAWSASAWSWAAFLECRSTSCVHANDDDTADVSSRTLRCSSTLRDTGRRSGPCNHSLAHRNTAEDARSSSPHQT